MKSREDRIYESLRKLKKDYNIPQIEINNIIHSISEALKAEYKLGQLGDYTKL